MCCLAVHGHALTSKSNPCEHETFRQSQPLRTNESATLLSSTQTVQQDKGKVICVTAKRRVNKAGKPQAIKQNTSSTSRGFQYAFFCRVWVSPPFLLLLVWLSPEVVQRTDGGKNIICLAQVVVLMVWYAPAQHKQN
jgi:hypothetical protein